MSVPAEAADSGLPPAASVGFIVPVFGTLVALIGLVWSADLAVIFRLEVYGEQFAALILGLALAIAFVRFPLRRGRPELIDWVLAALGLAAGLYLTARYPVLLNEAFYRPVESLVLSLILIVLVTEGTRRCAGWTMPIVFGVLLGYALFGYLLPGVLQARSISVPRLATYLGLDTGGLLGSSLIIAGTIVLSFMFFGRMLQACGGSDFFTDLAAALFGRFRGGSGKVEVVASALFGSISGSAVANVMTTGIITIPMMKKAGYRKETAAAIEAVSSTGGQIVPPVMGAAAFLMADFMQVPYGDVAIAAIVPALLYFFSIYVQVDLEAAHQRIKGYDMTDLPPLRTVIARGWFFTVPFAVLFTALFKFNMPAEKAALWGAAALVPLGAILGYRGHRLTLATLREALVSTGRDCVDIILICAISGFIIGILGITGLSFGLTLGLMQFGQGSMFLLLVAVALICIVLGTGLPTTAVYLLVAILAAPSLVQLGIPPMGAHMFVLFYGILSMITPPVALAAFAAANIAGAEPNRVGFKACLLGWPVFLMPFTFVYSPTLLLIGPVFDVVVSVATAFLGVWIGSCGLYGYFRTELPTPRRLAFVATGVALLIPSNAFAGGLWVEIVGVLAAALLLAREYWRRDAAVAIPGRLSP